MKEMTMRLPLSLAGMLLAFPLATTPAAAMDCKNPITQADMNACAADGLREVDATLNDFYGRIMGRLANNQPARQALQDSQRAWIRFRDAECAFATVNSRDGSVAPMLVAQCRQRLTSLRVSQFRNYLRCSEGDLDCPVPAR
jgi:uncharacterized protein YecT (DUF1311 family)